MDSPDRSTLPVIVLIRTTLREDANVPEYEALDARMNALVRTIPGFCDAKFYRADDGEGISLVRFASQSALHAWRDHPEHLEAQRAGRERFFARYDVRVCSVERAYDFALAY